MNLTTRYVISAELFESKGEIEKQVVKKQLIRSLEEFLSIDLRFAGISGYHYTEGDTLRFTGMNVYKVDSGGTSQFDLFPIYVVSLTGDVINICIDECLDNIKGE